MYISWEITAPVSDRCIFTSPQVATSIAVVYNVEMPTSTQSLLDSLQFVNLNLFDAFGLPLECLSLHGFSSELLFYMLAPVGLVAIFILGGVGSQWVQLLRRRGCVEARRVGGACAPSGVCAPSWRWKLIKRGVLRALPAISVISFLVFPAVSTVAFRAWDCDTFDAGTCRARSHPNILTFTLTLTLTVALL